MDSEYDRKFEEMKKYIPFLESMIKRLESSCSGSANPRQAQLDKIRSLRDLLLDKKKRMKMENLLKCEQVLVNLHAKVEQRDTKLDPVHTAETTDKPNLESVRHKLKSVVKRPEKAETLPEIARASEIEEVCTPGSKEPALFQRRPHKYSISPRSSPTLDGRSKLSNQSSSSKRNYTRVLVSPEPGSRALFSRRSPRKSPKRYSPTYNKKERKKASKQQSKDLNITLNVPEESLNSLNTKDILSRIINCSDGDVDIDTLRELRTQILGELKQTGASDDISDLILKSYNNKKSKKEDKKDKNEEVEEGELSDSDGELIESIYGSLVVVEKDSGKSNQSKKSAEVENQPRKIQICLVINADKDGKDTKSEQKSDFEMFDEKGTGKNDTDLLSEKDSFNDKSTDVDKDTCITTNETIIENKNNLFSLDNSIEEDKNNLFLLEKCTDEEKNQLSKQTIASQNKDTAILTSIDLDDDSLSSLSSNKDKDDIIKPVSTNDLEKLSLENKEKQTAISDSNELLGNMPKHVSEPNQFKANFYKPINNQNNIEPVQSKEIPSSSECKINESAESNETNKTSNELQQDSVEKPIQQKPPVPEQPSKPVVSEIDILQALKNEILSETIAIPGSEPITPALHQPKISKVASAKEILPKKRISIEKYKSKAVSSKPLSKEQDKVLIDNSKKQSLKLTEKECERFNFPSKLSLDDDVDNISDDVGEHSNISLEGIYDNLAPKSPEAEDVSVVKTNPVIIPADPVKTTITSSKADIDMRTLMPLLSSNTINMGASSIIVPSLLSEAVDASKVETKRDVNKSGSEMNKSSLVDPRVRRDLNIQKEKAEKVPLLSNPVTGYSNTTPSMTPILNPNMTPNRTPILNPNMTPIMTPNARSYEMTPSHQSFELDSHANRKHVYAPMFPAFEPREAREQSISKEPQPVWESNDITMDNRMGRREGKVTKWDNPRSTSVHRDVSEVQKTRYSDSYKYHNDPRNDRYSIERRDNYMRGDCPLTPLPSFGRSEGPSTPSHPFGRSECPPTPSHVFGRSECPATPNHSFGRSECPTTPSHPFGRTECPPTPSHSFGRLDCPSTPSHPFGRSECPLTPNHPFGRNERPMTPSHQFGRQEFSQNSNNTKYHKDPRLNRSSELESNYKCSERERSIFKERGFDRSNSFKSHSRSYNNSDTYGRNDRDHSGSRQEKTRYTNDQSERHHTRDHMSRRESSVGCSTPNDCEEDRPYYRKHKSGQFINEYTKSFEEVGTRRGFHSERSVGRNGPTEEHYTRSSSRARSIGRDNTRELDVENILNVKSQAGRSFTIDTSVNATFQDFIESGKGIQVFDYSFDARKRRSASVGRSLIREPIAEKPLSQATRINNEIVANTRRKNNFRRACSMGRDIMDTKTQKTLKDIKADFERFRSSLRLSDMETKNQKQHIAKEKHEYNRLSRKDIHETHRNKKSCSTNANKSYSPRKNYRDPRMRRELKDSRNSRDARERKTDGIVYSNDNIARGTILGSGYGVKNYKIPKLKRVIEEKEEKEKAEREKAEREKAEREKAEREKVEREKAERAKVEKAKAEKEKADKEKADKEKAEKEKAEKEKAEKEKAEKVKAEKEKAEKEKAEKEKAVKEQAEKEKAEKEKAEEDKAEKEKGRKKINTAVPNTKLEISEKREAVRNLETSSKPTGYRGSESINDSAINEDGIEKRITRSRKSELSKPISTFNRTRKSRKAVIHDSDSETEVTKNMNMSEDSDSNKSIADAIILAGKISSAMSSPVKENKVKDSTSINDLDSSFGIDELEMFSENIVSDPVIDNINALIADLDNDLNNSKNNTNDKFTNEFTLENMLESITSPESDDFSNTAQNESMGAPITSSLTTDKQTEFEISIESNYLKPEVSNTEHLKNEPDRKNDNIDEKPPGTKITHIDEMKPNNVDIVSTTDSNKDIPKKVDDKLEALIDGKSEDGCSTPDSTINNDDVMEKSRQIVDLPHSSKDTLVEMNSDVTSTHESSEAPKTEIPVKDIVDTNTLRKEGAPALESIGNLLSILQDSSKIKELLSMLGDKSGENEKIMKKLEKLRDIVSEDEDTNENDVSKNEKQHIEEKSEIPNIIDNELCTTNNESSINDKEIITSNDTQRNDNSNTNIDGNDKSDMNDLEQKQDDEKQPENQNIDELKADTVQNEDISIEKSEEVLDPKINKSIKKPPIKKKYMKKGKGKTIKKSISCEPKRVTRAGLVNSHIHIEKPPVIKKQSRELLKLHEDIKEMFTKDDILNATGIRMCRLAKLVDEKNTTEDIDPVVVIKKFPNSETVDQPSLFDKRNKKKPGPKSKSKNSKTTTTDDDIKVSNLKLTPPKYKPGPKSKTKVLDKTVEEDDPYEFESDSVGDRSNVKARDDGHESSSGSESGSLASSFGSTELLADLKKNKKRKRKGWQTGFIKPKRKKSDTKQNDSLHDDEVLTPEPPISVPDMNCFIDKEYCFRKNVFTYSCRLCEFSGKDIVHHYKKDHPHSEIPLSRMNPSTAKEAIEQCEEINFQAISKIPTEKYVCRFCYKEFGKSKAVLEIFFWHVVSMHTGEYKQNCSECVNVNRCPFDLDIPPPPKDAKGQLIGYICGKCNFTQISLENLKTHVIVRHNDEQTEVYTINLASLSRKAIAALTRRCNTTDKPRVLRSLRSNQSVTDVSDDRSDITDSSHASEPESLPSKPDVSTILPQIIKTPKPVVTKSIPMQAKITFESDDIADTESANENENIESTVKIEPDESALNLDGDAHVDDKDVPNDDPSANQPEPEIPAEIEPEKTNEESNDVVKYSHFKVKFTESGSKEYVCCINGVDNHYKTALLISIKKHIQMKHKEKWDGYCFECKVIVTPQGTHSFRDCFQHYLDKHMDNFPVLQNTVEETKTTENPPLEVAVENPPVLPPLIPVERTASPMAYINVRPIAELISIEDKESTPRVESPFPKIESVVSLMSPTAPPVVEPPRTSPMPVIINKKKPQIDRLFNKYEEAQAEVMSKKHQVVLETMMSKEKLLQVFKCAGRYCSFTSDLPEEAIIHASTHQRIGGENAMNCSYCDYDSSKNAIDLVMHVFKLHGRCQYSCAQCFYRAAASQLVGAHIGRIHGEVATAGSVLRTTSISQPVGGDLGYMLTREEAVSYYMCKHEENDGACKFRTFTPGKFYDHLHQKHGSATAHPCNLCPTMSASPTELVQHLKSHGLRLYQCTWCVHGADNEAELLKHASAEHPTKQPQAYLRIITNKDGLEMRVLPLAYLNKSKVPTEDVTPSGNKENPVKEAERSIELEKLIGFTNILIASSASEMAEPDSMANINPIVDASEPEIPLDDVSIPTPLETTPAKPATEPKPHVAPVSPRLVTPPPTSIPDITEQVTPVLKMEPDETSSVNVPSTDVVYCLDSDDDDVESNVIDLSQELAKTSTEPPIESMRYKKIPRLVLFRCPGCSGRFRTLNGFKRHFCPLNNLSNIECPHCQLITKDKNELADHYAKDHIDALNHVCGLCDMGFSSLPLAKKHFKDIHKVSHIFTVSKTMPSGEIKFIVNESEKGKALQKRKLSTEKTKRYGPEDIDKLPINPILESLVYCSLCEFNTKVRLNMVRHLQQHSEQQPVPQTAPVNPVPHLETNEKHFDRMVNLASSSAVNRTPDKSKADTPIVTMLMTPEAASRYPIYVPERQRFTCGAKGCSYISVNEDMFRFHWQTLHSDTGDFHCAHCPPYQHLDTSKPLTVLRIIAHLKMHDVSLYACGSCSYYHHKRIMVEKHVVDLHTDGQLNIIREESVAVVAPAAPVALAPTMDLKPWQCGLCQFKSMLRPEVVDHCAKIHQSKMQFKCSYCPFRTSMKENVSKHQHNSHPGKTEDIFYYYYRENSIPDAEDGTPRWMQQRLKSGVTESEVKTEVADAPHPTQPILPAVPQPAATSAQVDLNLVKKEVTENDSGAIESIEELCKRFGKFCEPNGIKYKCPLCKVVTEETSDAMQSHLYEELKYRKWSCTICSYKAFHKTGLKDHMTSEHRRQYQQPLELPVDANIEKWVAEQLEHQTKIIQKNKDNIPKLQIHTKTAEKVKVNQLSSNVASLVVTSVTAGPSWAKSSDKTSPMATLQPIVNPVENYSLTELEAALGPVGSPKNGQFCCPKCNSTVKDAFLRDHLESELNKIRWCCSHCSNHFQYYHEAQFHCKSVHPGLSTRPKEATRDPATRTAWVRAVIAEQNKLLKSTSQSTPDTNLEAISSAEEMEDSSENSLLVERYAERVPAPEGASTDGRPTEPDSDEESELVIDADDMPKRKIGRNCPYCTYSNTQSFCMRAHILKHYDLRPYKCAYCDFDGYNHTVERHLETKHKGMPGRMMSVPIPQHPPKNMEVPKQKRRSCADEDPNNMMCLTCETYFSDSATTTHVHDNVKPEFAKKGKVIVKCCICLMLRADMKSLQVHHNLCHPNIPINYAFVKVQSDIKEVHHCGYCSKQFKYLRDLLAHHNVVHNYQALKYTTGPYSAPGSSSPIEIDDDTDSPKRKSTDASILPLPKRIAKKSTSKLPIFKTVARKSTTKLPETVDSDCEEGYSYYGTKPISSDNYEKVTTLMPFFNNMVPFTFKKLSEIIKIDPKVVVKDIKK